LFFRKSTAGSGPDLFFWNSLEAVAAGDGPPTGMLDTGSDRLVEAAMN